MFARKNNQKQGFRAMPQFEGAPEMNPYMGMPNMGMPNTGMFPGSNMGFNPGYGPESFMYNQPEMNPGMDPNQSAMFPGLNSERLTFEIKENRRRINNLTRRVTRLENYLRIRDISDYSVDEDRPNSEFTL